MIRPEDSEVRDAFLTQPVDQVEMPEDLLLIVGTILLEADVSRGTAVLKQIKLSLSDSCHNFPLYHDYDLPVHGHACDVLHLTCDH